MKRYALAGGLLLAAGVAHADSAVTSRATDLLDKGAADATKIETLNQNTKVNLSKEQVGKWAKVKTVAGKEGWVSSLALVPESSGQAASAGASGNPLASVLAAGRTSANSTSATAAKGLSAADLENASPNPAELQKMQKFAATKDAANAFAQRSKLAASSLEYIQDTTASNNTGTTQPSQTGM